MPFLGYPVDLVLEIPVKELNSLDKPTWGYFGLCLHGYITLEVIALSLHNKRCNLKYRELWKISPGLIFVQNAVLGL